MTKEIPSLHIVTDNIPLAHYRAMKEVYEKGMEIRTQYDRKDSSGKFLYPPSKDAQVLISVSNPFNQPRYPAASCCEIGAYIVEILGVKDKLVLPFEKLRSELKDGKKLSATEWPYSYHQRLFDYPLEEGTTVNQIDFVLDKLSKDIITRRAVATTRVPEIDCLLKDDQPCLGEVQLRCTEDNGEIYLNMNTRWRSRDLFKAWPDNVVALTFMQQVLANKLGERIGREVKVGGYSDFSYSLHIYGQDIASPGSMGMTAQQYIDMGEEKVMGRARDSENARDNLVVPQLEDLLAEDKIAEWKFGEEQIEMIKSFINDLNYGKLMA
jgi:thymidylate synthase